MKISYGLVAAVFISTSAAFPAFAQDAATQAILDANQQAAVQQVQQYNEQMRQVADENATQARKSMEQNHGGAIDLDRLFGLVEPEPAPVAAPPQATIATTHHRYHHRRKHAS